jgi:hypothetical protein
VVAVYGDTHVDPVLLFDPDRERPPADALDLYFHAPLSLSLVGDAFAHNRMDRELSQLLEVYAGLAGGIIRDVQRQGGYVTGGYRGRAIPARLEITAIAHNQVPDQPTMRLHTHIYVGRTAAALDTGERHSVDLDKLRNAADFAWRGYLGRLVNESTDTLGFVWAPLPGHTSGDEEIVDPPMAEHIASHAFGVCPGDYGPREQIMADARWRAGIRESERYIAAEQARRRTG